MNLRMKLAWRRLLCSRLAKSTYWTLFRLGGGGFRRIETPNDYIADPFLYGRGDDVWLFYETLKGKKGVLGCFTYEKGAWVDLGVVLEEPWHLSYPQIFDWDGKTYMIPESCDFRGGFSRGKVRLYEAVDFPRKWRKVGDLIDEPFSDSTLLRRGGHWYLSCDREYPTEAAELWTAERLEGPWTRHPQSANHNQSRRLRRCGGRFVERDGRLFRVAQDCNGAYGKRLFLVPIEELTPTAYREGRALPFEGNFRHTYNSLVTSKGLLEVVDEMHYDFTPTPRTVLKALALPFQLLFRFSRRAKDGRAGWLFQILGVQFVHGQPVDRPALVQIRLP